MLVLRSKTETSKLYRIIFYYFFFIEGQATFLCNISALIGDEIVLHRATDLESELMPEWTWGHSNVITWNLWYPLVTDWEIHLFNEMIYKAWKSSWSKALSQWTAIQPFKVRVLNCLSSLIFWRKAIQGEGDLLRKILLGMSISGNWVVIWQLR